MELWRQLETIEPFGQLREDYRFAKLMYSIHHWLGGGKKPDGTMTTVEDYLLEFGEPPPAHMTAEQIQQNLLAWVDAMRGMPNA